MAKLNVDGVGLDYEVVGDGPPLLALMGLGANRAAWVAQVPDLSRRVRLYLLDNRGAGESDKPPGPYTMRRLADDAVALLDAEGVESAHVLGVSMGGAIAQELALSHPDRVRSLVLAATFGRAPRGVRQLAEWMAKELGAATGDDAVTAVLSLAGCVGPRQIVEAMRPFLFAPGFWERAPAPIREGLTRGFAHGFSVRGLAAQLAAVLGHDALGALAGVRAPTLVLHGGEDRLVPPHHAERLAAAIPGAQIRIFPGGGHGFFAEQAEAFNEAVAAWIEQVQEEIEGGGIPEAVEMPIDGTLDLHTFRPAEVQDLLDSYIEECRARGILEIRVIHGKGRGALRRTVHAALERHAAVVEFGLCEPGAGGWGATRAVLRPAE